MQIEFEKLEQRPGTNRVPVKMSREELEATAEKMADVNALISASEENLKTYSKEVREEIKEMEERRGEITRLYRFKREPKVVAGLWGFDFNDTGAVSCKACIEAAEKKGIDSYASTFATVEELIEHHAHVNVFGGGAPNDQHPLNAIWQRPLGTKWFVIPESGDIFGPVPVEEADLQKSLPLPETKNVEPFALAFDPEHAVPLLDAAQVSEAQMKLHATEKELAAEAAAGDKEPVQELTENCVQCGLALADHKEQAADPCKEAMLMNATREQQAQEARDQAKYGADAVLEPEQNYRCFKCHGEYTGAELQPIETTEGRKFACAECEDKITEAAEKAKKASKRKPKTKGGENAEAN